MISASVAPFARRSRSRIVAVLLLARTPSASGFAPFGALAVALAGVAFLVLDAAAGLGLAALALFWPLGAPFFGLAVFFEGAFSGATAAPSAPTAALVLVASTFSVFIVVRSPFAVGPRHDMNHSGALRTQADSAL
jgi:hypothetical protein